MSDLSSQYSKDIETSGSFYFALTQGTVYLGHLPVWALNELRPRGPSAMLPLSAQLKDVFDKFEQDFHAANLLEGKYIKLLASTSKWYIGTALF